MEFCFKKFSLLSELNFVLELMCTKVDINYIKLWLSNFLDVGDWGTVVVSIFQYFPKLVKFL